MEKIKFEDGQLVKPAYVTIDNVEYEIIPAVYEGNTPLSSYNLNKMQSDILEDGIIVSPTEPTADRRKVWFQKGKNLFDGQIVNGYGLNEDGATYGGSSRSITDFISIIANCNYCFSGATFKMVCIYDKDKNFISSLNGSLVNTFSAPSNAKYVRFAFDNTVDYSNLQVEYGEEATEYEEYINHAIYVKNDNDEYEEFIKKEEERLNKIEEIKITSLLNGATINNGWQNKLSRIGNLCHIELAFVPNTTNNITIYQIPENFIPKMSTIGLVMRGNLIGTAIVTASNKGQIQIQVPSNADVTWELNATWFI